VSDALVAELQAADEIVIAVPVYNFSVPAALKAWIDMVARARVTFRYTEDGPVGLLTGKRAWVIVGSGGTELDGPVDFATAWLRHVLGFLGIDDVRVIAADRQMVVGRERIAQAEAVIDELAVDPSKSVAPRAVLALNRSPNNEKAAFRSEGGLFR
jgi:FMN-dependent NADH-azoreductase